MADPSRQVLKNVYFRGTEKKYREIDPVKFRQARHAQAQPQPSRREFPLAALTGVSSHRGNKSTLRSGPEFHAEWLRDEPYDATATDPGSYIPGAWCQLSPGNREHGIRNARIIQYRIPIASVPFPGKRGLCFLGRFFRLVLSYSLPLEGETAKASGNMSNYELR